MNLTEKRIEKEARLASAYGVGTARFIDLVKHACSDIPTEDAQRIVNKYREAYPEIPTVWGQKHTFKPD